MPKFIIEYDSSRKNVNNEPLPLRHFIPGVLSLKNTLQPYTLYIGALNKSFFINKGSPTYKKVVTNEKIIYSISDRPKFPTKKTNNTFTFINKPIEEIPFFGKNELLNRRKEIINKTPPIVRNIQNKLSFLQTILGR